MFKKLALLILILSPLLWAIIVGYPVKNNRRVYETDNFKAYVISLKTQPRLAGLNLAKQINRELKSYSPSFEIAWPIMLFFLIGISILTFS